MVENSRKDPRAKVLSMTVRYKSATLDEFIEHHSHDVSRGGMYIKTPQPFPPGTLLKFEVKIGSDQRVIQGVGRVVWRRQSDEATETHPAGMGVKFIKLDEQSKSLISQVVDARGSETSAFDDVVATSERPPANVSEPPAPPAQTGSGNFFPSSNDNVPAPAPEDRTVMKQAAELLQEALREVTSTGDSEPATGKPDAAASLKPTRSATTAPAPANMGHSARGIGSVASGARDTTNFTSTVPPAEAAQAARASRSTDVSQQPRTSARAASRTAQRESRSTAQPRPQPYSVGASRREALGSSDRDSDRAAAAAPMPIEQVPAPRKSGGGAIRALVMLLLVGGVAGGVFVMTRKAPPPPPPPLQPEPAVTASAVELAQSATAAETAAVAPSTSEAPPSTASAEPSSSGTAPSAASQTAPTAAAEPAKQPEPSQASPEAEPKPKPAVRPRAPARKKQSVSTDTATAEQPSTPTETTSPKPAETEAPKAPADTPTGSDTTSSGASKPSPKTDSPPAAPTSDQP